MKLTGVTLFLTTCFLLVIFASCSKDVKPKTPEEILTSSLWQVEELRYLNNNNLQYYKRGGENNTTNYDNEYIKFDENKTGTLYGTLAPAPITWSFSNTDKTKIQFTVPFPGTAPLTVTWENIIFSEKSIRYTEYYIQNGVRVLGEGIRTPR